jgi:biopolymer transport protein ExbB/TolQ
MGFIGQIGYYFTHPDAVIFQVATALLYPVLFAEVAALVYVVFELGRFTVELVMRGRRRGMASLESIATMAHTDLRAGNPESALARLAAEDRGWMWKQFVKGMSGGQLTRVRLLKLLADAELAASARLERTRLFVRFGPILGLMGTLIPISPALVALAKGDTQTLSANLVIAFSTTVVGLLIGGLAFTMSSVRDRLYTQDVSDIEYALELLEV